MMKKITPMRKNKGKKIVKRTEKGKIKFHLSHERLFMFRCMPQPQLKFPLCSSDSFSARWSTVLPQLDFCREEVTSSDFPPLFSVSLIHAGSPPVAAFQEQSLFFHSWISSSQTNAHKYLDVPFALIHLSPLLWTHCLLQEFCSF